MSEADFEALCDTDPFAQICYQGALLTETYPHLAKLRDVHGGHGVCAGAHAATDRAGRARTTAATLFLAYSTVTDLARLRGWSTSVPLATAV